MYGKVKRYIPYILSIIVLVLSIVYLYYNADKYQELLRFSWAMLMMQLFLMGLFILLHGLNNTFFFSRVRYPFVFQ